MGASLPDKMFFKIGEVAQLAGVRTSVLRFWESEFAFLKPEKSSSGQRLYTKREVELILLVRQLLYEEKLTIEGVRKKISAKGRLLDSSLAVPTAEEDAGHVGLIRQIRAELQQLRSQL